MRALILACLAAAGCGGADSPSSPSDQDALRLTASSTQAVLKPGDVATLRFRLENAGSSAVTLQFPTSCQISPYIATASRVVVYPGGGHWVCAQVLTSLTLPAGGTKVEELRISGGGQSEMSSVYGLPPGDYLAYARLEGSTSLTSNSVAITVR